MKMIMISVLTVISAAAAANTEEAIAMTDQAIATTEATQPVLAQIVESSTTVVLATNDRLN